MSSERNETMYHQWIKDPSLQFSPWLAQTNGCLTLIKPEGTKYLIIVERTKILGEAINDFALLLI